MTSNSFDSVNYPNLPHSGNTVDSFQPTQKRGLAKWGLSLFALFLVTGGQLCGYRQMALSGQQAQQRMMVVPVEQKNLTVTVSANGTVEPDSTINVSPKSAGIMTKLLVEEGDYLKKGQILAYMDDSNLRGQLLQAKGRVAEAEANLRKLIAGNRPQEIAQGQARLDELEANLNKLIVGNRPQDIAQAKARVDSAKASYLQAEDDFRRNQMLKDEGAISQQALNQIRAARDSAKAALEEAQEALSLQKAGTRQEEIDQARAEYNRQKEALDLLKAGTRQEEIDQARAEVTSAKGALQSIETEIDDTIIRAPFSGIVSRKYAEPGAFVTPMTAGSSVSSATTSSILSLASQNIVVANVAESRIAKIKIGQSVSLSADAYPGQTFLGRVSRIATEATVEQNVTSFEIEVALLGDATKQLRSGMNVSVEFKVEQVENALVVPTVAVTRQDNKTGVLVGSPGQPPKFTPITTGATLDNFTEVKSGLDGSEHILINAPTKNPPKSGFSLRDLFGGSSHDGLQAAGLQAAGSSGGASKWRAPGGGPPG